ncbi:amidohydrolase [Rhodopseudomonas palustris]|uniref:amidohydrolase n=1 Tax=Rhodopseudomonas palustris TaxID=1076 RepID=UPI0022F0BB7E|nr:amidohydrolase [Rhodopseudomonas palustris]WBU28585.1 amidohydrolase [Rhodopseudomonas palustris]
MCIACNPAFQFAFRSLSLPSRRKVLKGAVALSAGVPFVAEAVVSNSAKADGGINARLASGLGGDQAAGAAPPVTIFTAKKFITMERGTPEATAVAVAGKRIVAAGSLDEVKTAVGSRPFTLDETFASKIVMPGLIDQHLHPVLGALTLAVEVIAPEDWVLPGGTHKAAGSADAYQARLKAADAKLAKPDAWLLTWGYHALWHGKLDRAALDAINPTRPIAVWHRSCHEFYLNTPALAALGITEAMTQNQGQASEQSNWREGHFWEGGLNLMMTPMLKVLATPERLAFGLKQMVSYLHANGVTAYMEPGALYTLDMWKLYELILGAPDTPMYATFIADGRGIVDRVGLDGALDAVEQQIAVAPEAPGRKLMFFPGQIKLFADGAIISQLMQMKDGYLDGHQGEWIIPPDELERRARLFWNAGYQIHTHVNGDLGLEKLLDILEKLNAEHPRADHRSVIVHFANSTEDQVGRIKRLGALVSANPYYTTGFADKYSAVGLGPERADAMVRAKSVLDQGVPLSYHSDLPMAPSAPLYLAWCGVNRLTPSGRVAGPEQRVSVDAALRAVTIEAAYSWRHEDQLGSIAPGKIANFTVLEQDPYAVPPEQLKDVPIWGTVFEGRVFPVGRA